MNTATLGRADRFSEYAMHAPEALKQTAMLAGDILQVLGNSVLAIDPRHRQAKRENIKKEVVEARNHGIQSLSNTIKGTTGTLREIIGAGGEGVSHVLEKLFRRKKQATSWYGKSYNFISNRVLNLAQTATQTVTRIPLGALGTIDILSDSIKNKVMGQDNPDNSTRAWQALGDVFLINGVGQGLKHTRTGESMHDHFINEGLQAGRSELKFDTNTRQNNSPSNEDTDEDTDTGP